MYKQNLIYWLVALSILLLTLDYLGILKPLRAPVDNLVIPVKQKIWDVRLLALGFADIVSNYPRLNKIFEEKDRITKENEEFSIKLDLLEKENTKLLYQLESQLPSTFKFIPAQVISVGSDMEVSKGANDGVKVGNTVVDGTVLIGRVSKVSSYRSRVILASSSDMRISVKTTRGTSGTIVGSSGKTIEMNEVLQKDPLFLEDKLVTSGQDGFPPNLLIGKITHITGDDVSVYKQAKIEPLVDYAKERIVFIISSL